MISQVMAIAIIVVCAGMFLLPFIDKIFHELAPIGLQKAPGGAMQLRLSDLLLTAVCYGLGLSVVTFAKPSSNNAFFICAAYLLISEMLGLFAAMDVCRKTRQKYRNDLLQRSCIFFIFFFIFPLTLPAALLAWGRWSRLAG